MANSGKNHVQDDMAEFYFAKDSLFSLSQAHLTLNGKESVKTIVKSGASKDQKAITNSMNTVFKLGQDGKSYVQEVSIPLKWLTKSAPVKAGDTAQVYFVAKTSPSLMLGGPEKFGCYKNVAKNPDFYGTAIFQETSPKTPSSLQLMNGSSLPVKMVDGKPKIELPATW